MLRAIDHDHEEYVKLRSDEVSPEYRTEVITQDTSRCSCRRPYCVWVYGLDGPISFIPFLYRTSSPLRSHWPNGPHETRYPGCELLEIFIYQLLDFTLRPSATETTEKPTYFISCQQRNAFDISRTQDLPSHSIHAKISLI